MSTDASTVGDDSADGHNDSGSKISSVLVTLPFGAAEIEQLRQIFAPAELVHCASDDAEGIAAALEVAEVAVLPGNLDDRFLAAPRLKWVHCDFSGLNGSARPEIFAKNLIVTGAAGRSSPALAQHAFFFALALTYDARALLGQQQAHVWRGIEGYSRRLGLSGKTLGIVGFGSIGEEMATLGRAFGMRVIAHKRSVTEVPPTVDVLLSSDRGDTLDQLITESDVIMLACQLTNETFHLFSDQEFEQMKDSAMIINMARGPVIDEQALIGALRAGKIAAAGLDVFETEPLPAESELWDVPNLMITPHSTPAMPDRTERSIATIAENVRRYRAGEPLLNALTPRDLYTVQG